MTKFTLPSLNKQMVPLLEKHDLSLNNEITDAPKRFFFQVVSEMSHYLFNLHKSKRDKYHIISKELEAQIEKEKATTLPKAPLVNKQACIARISESIMNMIMHKLVVFEVDQGFLDKDLTLNSLAKNFGTNHSYLSKIVHYTKGKSFKAYLNDLRIVHAHKDLQQNPQKRRFTIEAIAFDYGFRSAESFSKKFKARYGIYPSKFLKSLSQ